MGWEGPTTWKQYEVWMAWYDMQWNQPSRSDWYQMRTAANVLRAAGDRNATEERMRLRFLDAAEVAAREGKGGVPPDAATVARWRDGMALARFTKQLGGRT